MSLSRRASWPLYLIGSLVVVAALAMAAWNVELPYLAYSPGPVADAADSVVAEEVEVYPPQGELLMLTILSQDVNVFDALVAGADPTIDLIREEAVRRPGETDEQYRNRILEQMDDSNFVSIQVALEALGYPQQVVITEILGNVPAVEVLEPGDVIVSVDGVEIDTIDQVAPLIEAHEAGDVIPILVERRGEQLEVQVQLAEREDEPGVAMVGVVLRRLVETPFSLSIEEGDVGGPSAGLMHALAIIDVLTEGELTKGHVIAGTGTIDFDGNVGAIGGIRQKVPAAEAAGASHILVPQGNHEAALTAVRDHIEIVPVATIEEALAFLDSLESA
ncbi:MAG: YlbL family protein [Acidimicrobiia bacterium]